MIAGIAVDSWKLPIFERHLRDAGFSWTQHELHTDTLLLKVAYDDLSKLEPVVRAANTEAALARAESAGARLQ